MKVRMLKRLRIKRVDLVERGANQEAEVVLFKSEDGVCKQCGQKLTAEDRLICLFLSCPPPKKKHLTPGN